MVSEGLKPLSTKLVLTCRLQATEATLTILRMTENSWEEAVSAKTDALIRTAVVWIGSTVVWMGWDIVRTESLMTPNLGLAFTP